MSLSKNEIDYKIVFEAIQKPSLVLSNDLTIITLNLAYQKSTNTEAKNLIGKHISEIFPDHPKIGFKKERSTNSLTTILLTEIDSVPFFRYDILRPNGIQEEKYWRMSTKPIIDNKNEIIYILLEIEDVTEFVAFKKKYPSQDKTNNALLNRLFLLETALKIRKEEIQELGEVLELNNGFNKKVLTEISDYKYAIDTADIVAITDQKGIILHVNDNFCKISKYSREELIGQDHRIINSGFHSKDFIRLLWKTISKGNVWKGEIKNKAKDDSFYWVRTTIIPFLDEKRKPVKYLALRSDITHQKEIGEDLVNSEGKYRDLFENSLVAMFINNPKTRKTIVVNEIGISLFGYKSEKDFLKNYKPEKHFVNIEDLEKLQKEILINGEANLDKVAMKKKDGTLFWAKLFSKLNIQKDAVQTVLVDITAQEEIYTILKNSEEKYKNIFSNTLVATFTIDIETSRITEVNDKGFALFGYQSREDFLKNFNPILHYVNVKDQQTNIVILVEKGETSKIIEMRRLDGSLFWAKFANKLNKNNGIAHISILDVTNDIKFQEELEEKVVLRNLELTQSLIREKESNDMKSNFVSMASHEFRTPLTTILTSASLIKKYEDYDQQELRVKHIDRITSTVNHLVSLLNDFLSLEKLRKGIVNGEVASFNLPEFIEEIAQELDSVIILKKQHIEYTHQGEVIVLQSPKILKNILINLISNASKYSENNMPIEIHSIIISNTVTITIKDQGIGIPIEEQQKLFSDFFRASNTGNIKGTGLGLSIVKKYVELLDGNIYFESQANKGSSFSFSFPQLKELA